MCCDVMDLCGYVRTNPEGKSCQTKQVVCGRGRGRRHFCARVYVHAHVYVHVYVPMPALLPVPMPVGTDLTCQGAEHEVRRGVNFVPHGSLHSCPTPKQINSSRKSFTARAPRGRGSHNGAGLRQVAHVYGCVCMCPCLGRGVGPKISLRAIAMSVQHLWPIERKKFHCARLRCLYNICGQRTCTYIQLNAMSVQSSRFLRSIGHNIPHKQATFFNNHGTHTRTRSQGTSSSTF